MPAFTAIAQRVNAAVERRLADATATYQGGDPFAVLLDREQTGAFGGGGDLVDAPALTCSFDLRHALGLAEGSELVINGVRHRVGRGVQPDSSGWVTVEVFAA